MSGPELERERFTGEVEWPAPAPEPERERADDHRGPLDRLADVEWLEPDDPRRRELEGEQVLSDGAHGREVDEP
jgi:hypothetical protein